MVCVRNRLVALGAIAALLALISIGGTGGRAQDASPVAGTPTGGDTPHPAHIHAGACPDVGEVVFPLADVQHSVADAALASPVASPVAGGSPNAIPAEVSVTTVDADLATILSAPHAINVHLSTEEIGTYIACGDIGGTPNDRGDLFIGLAERNASGYSGTAWLHEEADGTTIVTIFLAQGLAEGSGGADLGTPAA